MPYLIKNNDTLRYHHDSIPELVVFDVAGHIAVEMVTICVPWKSVNWWTDRQKLWLNKVEKNNLTFSTGISLALKAQVNILTFCILAQHFSIPSNLSHHVYTLCRHFCWWLFSTLKYRRLYTACNQSLQNYGILLFYVNKACAKQECTTCICWSIGMVSFHYSDKVSIIV